MNASNGACAAMGENEPSDDRFVFHVTLPSLQEMAAYRVALAIWYSYISRSKYTEFKKETNEDLVDGLGIEDGYWQECNRMVESLGTPKSIEEILKNTVEAVRDETGSWIRHFKYDTFSYHLKQYCIRRFDANFCIWLPNGKIDIGKTGPMMLSAAGLTDVQKFAIMSEFCMENELKKFRVRSLPKSFIRQVTFDQDYLMYYWIHWLKKDLGKIPLNNFNSVDIVMAVTCENEHWTAFEYFWNRLGADDQVTVAMFRFDNHSTYFYQERTLCKMSWQQQRSVLSQIPDQILLNFWVRLNSPMSAMWTWKHSKDLMTVEQFAEVVNEIFYRKVPFEEEMRLFMKIWDTASDQQRNHVIQTMGDEIIRPFFCMTNHSPAAFEFLYNFLSMKSDDFRRTTMLKAAPEFGSNIADPNSMTEILNLCLPNPDDQLMYKRSIMESHEMKIRGQLLFNDSNFHNLKLYVQFYSTDPDVAQGYLRRILKSKMIKKQMYVTDVEKWNKFSEFVDDIFANDVASGLNLKKEFITTYASNCRTDWNDDNSLDEMIKVLGMVFTSNDELEVVKQMLLTSFRKTLLDSDYWPWFEKKYFNGFVSWCVGGDEGVDEFKKSLSIDAIFDEYFNKFDEWYSEDGGFDKSLLRDLNKCLEWYFMGVEGARSYKLRRLNAFGDIEIFQSILEQNDESCLDALLTWFFDDDGEVMRKFKTKKLKFRGKR